MHYETVYQDRIYEESDNGELTLIWQNSERPNRWGGDNEPDSEYHKMMDMDSEYHFADWDNPDLPNFVHYVYEIVYRVTKKERVKYKENIKQIYSLVEEYMST